MERPEIAAAVQLWRGCFEKLLAIGEEQKKLLDAAEVDWERFAQLAREIEAQRQRADNAGETLKRAVGEEEHRALFRSEVQSTALLAKEAIDSVVAQVQAQSQEIVTQLRHTREHQKLNRAYYGMDRDSETAYYFDSKR